MCKTQGGTTKKRNKHVAWCVTSSFSNCSKNIIRNLSSREWVLTQKQSFEQNMLYFMEHTLNEHIIRQPDKWNGAICCITSSTLPNLTVYFSEQRNTEKKRAEKEKSHAHTEKERERERKTQVVVHSNNPHLWSMACWSVEFQVFVNLYVLYVLTYTHVNIISATQFTEQSQIYYYAWYNV